MNRVSAQRLLVDVDPKAGFDHGWAPGEELADALHHDVEVAHRTIDRRQPRDRPEDRRDNRRHAEQFDVRGRHRVPVGKVGPPDFLKRPYAPARRVEQPYQWQPPLKRPLIGRELRAQPPTAASTRTAAHRKVPCRHHNLPPVDATKPIYGSLRCERGKFAVLIGRITNQPRKIPKRPLVGEPGNPFSDCELPLRMLPLDASLPTHMRCHLATAVQLCNFLFPGHVPTLPPAIFNQRWADSIGNPRGSAHRSQPSTAPMR